MRTRASALYVVVLAFLLVAGGRAWADTLTLTPTRDTSIFSENNNAAGIMTSVYVGDIEDNALRRALLGFDLSSVPAGASVTGVTLKIHLNKSGPGPGGTIALHKLLADWGEGTSGPSGEGKGAAPTAGSATWNDTFFPGQHWAKAGGDFVASPSATVAADAVKFYTFSDPKLAADVTDWLANPAGNFGWILTGNETAPGSALRFDSREASAANRPVLTITYAVPEPAAMSALAGLALVLTSRRR